MSGFELSAQCSVFSVWCLYHSTLGLIVIKKKKKYMDRSVKPPVRYHCIDSSGWASVFSVERVASSVGSLSARKGEDFPGILCRGREHRVPQTLNPEPMRFRLRTR